MTLRVEVDTRVWQTRQPDFDDRWDHGSTAGCVSSVDVWYSDDDADPIPYRAESFDVDARPGDVVYVVVVDYESGDTFGRSGGKYTILDVFTDAKEAIGLVDAAAAVPKSTFQFTYNGKDYYADWVGYFEALQEVRVWTCAVGYKKTRD